MRVVLLILVAFIGACRGNPVPDPGEGTAEAVLPYGSWPSPISAASTVEASRSIHSLAVDEGYLYWVESRPEEGGRNTLVRWKSGGEIEELLPEPWNVRSRIHEYGGRSFSVSAGVIWFSHFQDQRLYSLRPGSTPEPVTPEADLRYGACSLDAPRNRLICIREDHRPLGEPRNALVAIPLEGMSEGEVLFEDSDFVSAASLSPDGSRVAFVTWNHPNMPWDNTTLWSAGFDDSGALSGLFEHNPGSTESVLDPQWGAENKLHVLSDRDNWWAPYLVEEDRFTALETGLAEVEIGGPAWSVGSHFYRLTGNGKMLAQVVREGVESLYLIDTRAGHAALIDLGSAAIGDVLPVGDELFVVNAPATRPAELLHTDFSGATPAVIRKSRDQTPGAEWVPAYQLVTFPTGGGAQAHGIYLPPVNPGAEGPEKTAPPLIVTVHGGPTSMARPAFSVEQLYWTSRGFAILDLNYRGSSGFGRQYRQALYGEWGIADVEDAVSGAKWLAEQGLADPQRLIIRGGSAGGYTTLAAHAFHNAFSAGASYFGISDMEALASETHKFESRYLDQLMGPYPERKDIYVERSPINHLGGFKAPLLLLQGLDDQVVPPNQSEIIFEALKSRGVPTAYLPFEGEGHGFRKSENSIRALEAELYFYARVFGFEPADKLPPLEIIGIVDGVE